MSRLDKIKECKKLAEILGMSFIEYSIDGCLGAFETSHICNEFGEIFHFTIDSESETIAQDLIKGIHSTGQEYGKYIAF